MADTTAPEFGSRSWRLGNAIVSVLARAGIGPIYLVCTRGRKTGRLHTNPVVPVTEADRHPVFELTPAEHAAAQTAALR